MPTRRPSLAATLTSTLLLAACGGGGGGTPPPPPATNIAKTLTNSGDNQVGPAGQSLPNALRVLVTDAQSKPVSNVTVVWGTTGGGSLPLTSSSDANGIAVVTWTLGANAGAQSATASKTGLTGSPVTFGATAQIQGATQMASNGGNGQVGPAGQPLGTPISVIVKDQNNVVVAGVIVNFAATAHGGSVSQPTATTSAGGIASVTWTLGDTVPQTARASVTGLINSPINFTATAQIQGATQLAKAPTNSGDGQTDTVLATLPNPYRVIARDQNSAPVQGVVVNWTVTGGGGSVPSPTSATDINGIAVITHTFGSTVGAQNVQASVAGLLGQPVAFASTATPGIPTQIAKTATASGDNQSGRVGNTLAQPHRVIVKDGHGNPVPSIPVQWVAGVGGATPKTSPVTTDANGIASDSITLGATIGGQADTAKVTGLAGSPVAFNSTASALVTKAVSVNDNFYTPADVTIEAGDSVQWTWNGVNPHSVTLDPPDGRDSGVHGNAFVYKLKFTNRGTFTYFCTFHGRLIMNGSVTVQ